MTLPRDQRAAPAWMAPSAAAPAETAIAFVDGEPAGARAGVTEAVLTMDEGLKSGEIAARLRLHPDVIRQRKVRTIRRVMGILGTRTRQ